MLATSETTERIEPLPNTACKHASSNKSMILSCMIGNALEWYDFIIYGYFASIFGMLFFPSAEPLTQILASWGVFWSGFIARPLGSVIFGHIGDKTSRKHALTLSIYIMAIPTALMGLLPTYNQIGILATITLVILRLCQGFALGGEFTGSMVFMVEHAPKNNRGLWGSWVSFSAVIGVIIGSTVVTLLNECLSTESMHVWGWRLPFLISILGSVVGGYMRTHLKDPEVYLELKARSEQEHTPLKQLFLKYKSKVGLIILLDFLTAIGFFIVVIFFSTYFNKYLNFPENISFIINTVNMIILALAILAGGLLADRFEIKKIIGYSSLCFVLFSYPLFNLLRADAYLIAFIVQGIFAVMLGVFFGTAPVALVGIMPMKARCSGLSIGHNISMAIFGGGAPFLATTMIAETNNLAAPAFLLVIAGLLSYCSKNYLS